MFKILKVWLPNPRYGEEIFRQFLIKSLIENKSYNPNSVILKRILNKWCTSHQREPSKLKKPCEYNAASIFFFSTKKYVYSENNYNYKTKLQWQNL